MIKKYKGDFCKDCNVPAKEKNCKKCVFYNYKVKYIIKKNY